MRTFRMWLLCVMWLYSSVILADTVIHCPNPDQPLNQKWSWAKKEAQDQHLSNGYWIGYRIERLMGSHEFFISGSHMSFDRMRSTRPTLSEILEGTREPGDPDETDEQKLKRTAKEALNEIDHTDKYE